MHEHQVDIDDAVLRGLVDAVLPQASSLPLRRIPSDGTINQVYRLGTAFVVRVPLIDWGAEDATRERTMLPLVGGLPLTVPDLVAVGPVAPGVPWPFTVLRWIPGRRWAPASDHFDTHAVDTLASHWHALWALPAPLLAALGAQPLDEMAEPVRAAIGAASDVLDAEAVTRAWDRALAATEDPGPHDLRTVHADPTPGNILHRDGRPIAMIDWAAAGYGDRALDLIAPWWLMDARARRRMRVALAVSEAVWNRGRLYALRKAVYAIGYYSRSNPGFHRDAQFALNQIMAEDD